MIKAILFDFAGVLIFKKANSRDFSSHPALLDMARHIGKVTNDAQFKEDILKKYELDEAHFQKNIEIIGDQFEALDAIWELLPSLRNTYKLAIINNGTGLTLPLFKKQYPIDTFFDSFICSGLEGMKKPKKEIYLHTTNLLNVQPDECLFMDDKIENIIAAEKLGMKTIHWEDKDIGFKRFNQFLNSTGFLAAKLHAPSAGKIKSLLGSYSPQLAVE